MTRPPDHITSRDRLGCWTVVLVILFTVIGANAGVGLPPIPNTTDTNVLEQYRIKVFYDAQKSEQRRLLVAQQRYDKMLTNRAHILQAMANELSNRQLAVTIPRQPASGNGSGNHEPNVLLGTVIGAAIIGLGMLGFRAYLNRQSLKGAAGQNS